MKEKFQVLCKEVQELFGKYIIKFENGEPLTDIEKCLVILSLQNKFQIETINDTTSTLKKLRESSGISLQASIEIKKSLDEIIKSQDEHIKYLEKELVKEIIE
jgi:hypothetical protein